MVKVSKSERSFVWKWFFFCIFLALVIYSVWFFFFSYKECVDWDCFNSRLEECRRTEFIGGSDMIFEYKILRSRGDFCRVNIELLQGEINNRDSAKLVGQEMICELPKSVLMIPESDIGNCHGRLKEGLQDLIINKLHNYIVQNLGRINLEIVDIPQDL